MVKRRTKLLSPVDIIQRIYNHLTNAYQVTDTVVDNSALESCSIPADERSRRESFDGSQGGAAAEVTIVDIPALQAFRVKHITLTEQSGSDNTILIEYGNGRIIWLGTLLADQAPHEVSFGFGSGPETPADSAAQVVRITSTGAVEVLLHGDFLVDSRP